MALTLLTNGVIYTSRTSPANTMVLANDVIAFVGHIDGTLMRRKVTFDHVVDLDGALVTPAFVDAHVHSTATGLALNEVDLSACQSRLRLLDRVADQVRHQKSGPILGHGWDELSWHHLRLPSCGELDAASGGRPVYLARKDRRAALVSSNLLPGLQRLRGYDSSGLLTAEAHDLARRAAYALIDASMREDAQRATRQKAASNGIGLIHEFGSPELSSADDLALAIGLASREPGPDIVGYWGEFGGAAAAINLGAGGAAGDIFVNGTPGVPGACCHGVFDEACRGGRGCTTASHTRNLTASQVCGHVVSCAKAGLQAGFHTVGDGALETVLAGFEEAAIRIGWRTIRSGRHRIEQAEVANPTHISRLAKLGIYASLQPVRTAGGNAAGNSHISAFDNARARAPSPYSSLAAAGVLLTFGSSSPVTAIDPWSTVQAAANHYVDSEQLTVDVAFSAHTVGGWRAARQDHVGMICPDSPATFAVWRVDGPLTATGLPQLQAGDPIPQCIYTVVRGRAIYRQTQ